MSKIVTRSPAALAEADEAERPTRALDRARPFDLFAPAPARERGGFFSFQYSFTEVSLRDGRTQVQARRVRLEDGRLSSERFEGELGGTQAFVEAARAVQAQAIAQCAALFNPWSWLLPAARKAPDDGE